MTTPNDPHSRQYSHVNGSLQDTISRLAVSELCKGWPVYRDASEWANFRSLFADDAHVWTTWSGALPIDDFIAISKEGKARGVFIQHRECGTLVELEASTGRAVGKMKATITQRFVEPGTGVEYDVDCDCRFLFFCEDQARGTKDVSGAKGEEGMPVWKARYVKLVYEKDRVVPADGRSVPVFEKAVLEKFPEGYRFLGAAQEQLGYEIDVHLATVKDVETWDRMYQGMESWLAGEDPKLFW